MVAGALVAATALAGAAARGRGLTPIVEPPAGGATFTAPPAGAVTFGGHLDRTAVMRGGDGLVRMELVIGAKPDESARTRRVPTDLVIVLDRSGSMTGEKIEHARAAVRELVAELGANDRFGLVTYSNDAAVAIPLTAVGVETRVGWAQTIAAIHPDGGTNMSSGLDLGLDLVEGARTAGRVPRVILISDGLANQGDATPEGLTRRAGRAGHGEYTLSTVGVGADFNEYLMSALADAGTGNYYYLRGSEDLASVFAREFDAARTTVASALAVRIVPAPGVQVLDAAGYPLTHEADAVTFRPGALFAGQERRVWVTLAVPHDAAGEHDLGRFALSYAGGPELIFDTPRVACVEGEDQFYSSVDVPAWSRSLVVDSYNKMKEEVAREVKAGRRDEALDKVRRFKDEARAMNQRLQSPPVAAQIGVADTLEADVKAAFEGAGQAAKQGELSKKNGAEALDARRAGSKK
jgi:Ca-activated chloride channel family protein